MDISSGQGEYLSTLLDLLQVARIDRKPLSTALKANHIAIFPTPGTTAGEALDRINDIAYSYGVGMPLAQKDPKNGYGFF